MSNLLLNSSFEQDTDANGLADSWTTYGSPVTTLDTARSQRGFVSQKVIGVSGTNVDIRSTPLAVTAGLPYTLSVYAWVEALNASPAGQAVIKVEWYDNSGQLVNYDYTPLTTADFGFARRSISSTPGVGAVTGRVFLAIENGGTVYWDAVQLEQAASASSYTDGPSAPSTTNLIGNSSFEQDTVGDGLANGWTQYGAPSLSQDTGRHQYGSVSQKMVGTASTNEDIHFALVDIVAGSPYTLSAYAWIQALNVSPAGQAVVKVEWYDGADSLTDYAYTAITTADSGFVRRSVTSTPPAGSVKAKVTLAVENGGTVYWDAVQLEQAASAGPYMEGPPIIMPVATNPVVNSSFEVDLNNDGLADFWGSYGDDIVVTRDSSRQRHGAVSQKMVGQAGKNVAIFAAPIGVTPGQEYTLSAYAWITALSPSAQAIVKVEWHDNGGNVVDYAYTVLTATDTGFERRTVTSTAPAGTVTANIFLAVENGGTVYWDAVQLEEGGAATGYSDGPTSAKPILNLLANTSFEWDSNSDGLADGWSTVGTPTTTLDGSVKNFGAYSQMLTGNPATTQGIAFTPITVTPGLPYTLSAYCFVGSLNGGASADIVIEWLGGGGTVIGNAVTSILSADSGFVRRSLTSTAPADTLRCRIMLRVVSGGTINVDDMQLEQSDTMGPRYLEPDWDWIVRGVYTSSDPFGSEWAIGWNIDRQNIRPYEASFAAIGCAAAGRTFNISKFKNITWNWCAWYRDHIESDGTMYDYDTNNGTLQKLATRDSTDAYAGMYLQALRAAYMADPRPLTGFETSIGKALDAIVLTQQPDGLTWALPTYKVKFLEDQLETAAGCYAAAELAGTIGNSALQSRAIEIGDRMYNGIAKLWNPQNQTAAAYNWAKHEDGTTVANDWSASHDVEQQLWAMAFGATSPTRAAAMLDQVMVSTPDWADQSATHTYNVFKVAAFQRFGRHNEAAAGLDLYASRSQSNGRAWDWNPAHAGMAAICQLNSIDMVYDLSLQKFVRQPVKKVLNINNVWMVITQQAKQPGGGWSELE